ncbi:MAG TPA: YggS family pyridoxal phosphate-dependent enzyme [Myxococcaceae bacterium]|nr:YggS family pyridoxal phosphate-dependent enzyme [Myxococcaceae bacterium]
MSTLAQRLEAVQSRIRDAAVRAGRDPATVTLIAVSKRQPAAAIREAYALGVRDFGENYAQELRDKAAELADLTDLRWHAIGPLQTNKARYVADVAHAFHALDREAVAEALVRRRGDRPLEVFLEVNLAGEASKGGVAPSSLSALHAAIAAHPTLHIRGLMALPPLTAAPEDARPHFRQLAGLARDLHLDALSMGTTADFEVAIGEGATHVRVGTAIFGPR